MKDAGGPAEATIGEASVECRRVERLAGLQAVAEVERVVAAADADLVNGRLLDADPPASAPTQRAEPNEAVLFAGAAIEREPRVHLMTRGSAPAIENFGAR